MESAPKLFSLYRADHYSLYGLTLTGPRFEYDSAKFLPISKGTLSLRCCSVFPVNEQLQEVLLVRIRPRDPAWTRELIYLSTHIEPM
jgi:hypothetical protein